MEHLLPFLLPLLSVLLGYAVALAINPKERKFLKLLMAFSGSFLLSLTLMHLLPEVYSTKNENVGIFIML